MSAPYLNRTPGGLPGTHAARPTATPTATASPPRSPMGLATVDPAFCASFPAMATRPKRPPVDPASTLFGAAAQKRSAAAGGSHAAPRAGRGGGAEAAAGSGIAADAGDRSGPGAVDDPLGTAGERKD